MSQLITFTKDAENGAKVNSVGLDPRFNLSKKEALEVLALSHFIYAKNQHVKHEGTWLHFEPPKYHFGLASMYRSRARQLS